MIITGGKNVYPAEIESVFITHESITEVAVIGLLGQARTLFYLCAVVLVASLVLGGATRGGSLSDPILQ
jgi:acyl-CoA synthetase (AMP-forming)/AMP-acid ligase II